MGVADIQYDYDFKKELERKVMETLESAASDFESGRIGVQQYVGMMRGIHKCTSGIIDGMLTVAVESELLDGPKEQIYSAVFTDGPTVKIVRYKHGDDKGYYLRLMEDKKWRKNTIRADASSMDTVKSAWQRVLHMVNKLEQQGFERLA